MAYIYEQDVTKVGGNLQKTVAYLLSLHKNEYEWNLLGIRVIGVKEALPIPDGTYDYGDAYMIGNKTDGFELWIYTRADEFHSEAYWFDVGQFPKAGPKGDKGDGIGQVQLFQEGLTTNLTYDSTNGGKNESISSMTYVDSTTGQRLTQTFQMTSRLPIIPGKYVSIDATTDNKKMEVKVDDTALALDYYKITKGDVANVPAYSPTKGIIALPYSYQNSESSLVRRGLEGEAKFTYGIFGRWNDIDSGNAINFNQIWRQCGNGQGTLYIASVTTNTGTLTANDLTTLLTMPQMTVNYQHQIYYRMDPTYAKDGTLNYIHIDSIDDGNGGYKATGKCFSVTVSTREWQVVDLDFGGSTRTTHNLTLTNSSTGTNIYFSLTNNRPETYEGAPAGLLEALDGKSIACTVDANGTYSAGMITTDGTNFKATYGNGEQLLIEQMQVSITDNIV